MGSLPMNNTCQHHFRQPAGDRHFDNSAAVILPKSIEVLPAIYCFIASGEYTRCEVRKINQKVTKLQPEHSIKIPFDLAHWQKAAAEKFPHGLPKPLLQRPDPMAI